MSVTSDDARRIAELARLDLADEELERLTGELNRILDHVVTLGGLELSDVPDASVTTGTPPSLRDAAAETPDPLARGPEVGAPDWRDGFFVVPPLPGLSDGTEGGAP